MKMARILDSILYSLLTIVIIMIKIIMNKVRKVKEINKITITILKKIKMKKKIMYSSKHYNKCNKINQNKVDMVLEMIGLIRQIHKLIKTNKITQTK